MCIMGGCVLADRAMWAWIMEKLQCAYKLMVSSLMYYRDEHFVLFSIRLLFL